MRRSFRGRPQNAAKQLVLRTKSPEVASGDGCGKQRAGRAAPARRVAKRERRIAILVANCNPTAAGGANRDPVPAPDPRKSMWHRRHLKGKYAVPAGMGRIWPGIRIRFTQGEV